VSTGTKEVVFMSLTRETVEKIFAELVGRPIEPAVAEAAAAIANALNDGLNAVEPEPIFLVEPSTPFQAAYRPERREPDAR
jgi:hypothetical protein